MPALSPSLSTRELVDSILSNFHISMFSVAFATASSAFLSVLLRFLCLLVLLDPRRGRTGLQIDKLANASMILVKCYPLWQEPTDEITLPAGRRKEPETAAPGSTSHVPPATTVTFLAKKS